MAQSNHRSRTLPAGVEMMTSIPNRYCQRLGIPVPHVEDAARRPEVTLFQLVVVALLERGGPMTVDEIAARLDRGALPARLARPDGRR